MGIISNDSIKIDGLNDVELRDMFIEVKPNEHGYAKLSLRIKDNGKPEDVIKRLDDKMVTINSTEDGNSGILFKGYISKCTINSRESSGVINIELITTSIKLDEERVSKSYQKEEDTYAKVVDDAIKKNGGENYFYEKNVSSKKIGKPIIRYNETAWEFVKRIASRNRLQVVVDETADKPTFSVGYKEKKSVSEDKIIKSSIMSFSKMKEYLERKLNDKENTVKIADYEGIQFASYNNYNIGDSVAYRGKSYNICSKVVKMELAQLIFVYEAGTDKLYGLEPIYNELLMGRCLEGKVEKTESDYIKLNLDIDKEKKSESELYSFKWIPETSNVMYSMPEKDTVVSLYIGGCDEGDAIVVNALRRKEKGKKYEKECNKYYTTASGMRMVMAEEEVGFTGNSTTNSVSDEHSRNTGKAHINIHDKDGIVIGTDKKIHIQANNNIEISSGNKLTINGKQLLQMRKDRNALKIKNKIAVIGNDAPFLLGVGVPVSFEKPEKPTVKNTGKGRKIIRDKDGNETIKIVSLTAEQEKINEIFRGDQFKAEDSFSRSIEPELRSDMVEVNRNCTCIFEENFYEEGVLNNDSYYKRFNDDEMELKEKLKASRATVPEVKENTVMQKVIGKDAYDDYILGEMNWETKIRSTEKKKTATGCISRAQDAAPFTTNSEEAYTQLRLDYKNSEFKEMSEKGQPVYVIRCKCNHCPTNDEYMRVDAENPWNKPPCTGQGFVGADEELIPEFTYGKDGQQITSGAIYAIDKDGNEYMAAWWDNDAEEFVEIG